jgi:hypothetical protein
LQKTQVEVRLVALYTLEALTEYLRDGAKFDCRGATLSTPPHVAGTQAEAEDYFNQVLFVLFASNLLSVGTRHVAYVSKRYARRNMPSGATVTQQSTVLSSVRGLLWRPTSQIIWMLSSRAERLKDTLPESSVRMASSA